jgi:sugar phosphate isomerase/epimerase
MNLTRRDVGKIALAALPLAKAFAKPNSTIHGVRIGAITYSFRGTNDLDEIIKDYVQIGLSEVELMSNHAESGAGAPSQGGGRGPGAPGGAPGQGRNPGGPPAAQAAQAGAAPGGAGRGRGQMTPEQQAAMQARAEELRKWRTSVSMDKFKEVRKKFDDAGINLGLLTFNMRDNNTDDEIEYAFQMAKALGAHGITTSTTLTMSKRIAPFADKHKLLVGYHGHDQTNNPNEFATLETYAAAMAYGKYNGVNLDIGHFTASNYDAVAFIKEHHARITNLHLKDRKKDHGPNTVWGEGDTPLREVLQLMKAQKYPFPANIEYEYRGDSDPVTEVAKCFEFCKKALA